MSRTTYNLTIALLFTKDSSNPLGWGRRQSLRRGPPAVDDGWRSCRRRSAPRKADNSWRKAGTPNSSWVRLCNISKILFILLVPHYPNGIFLGCTIFFFWGGVYQYIHVYISHSNLCNLGVTRSNFVKPVSIYLRCATNTLTNKNEESSSEGPRIFDSMLVFVPFDLLVNPLKGTTSNYFFAECGLLHTAVHV